MYHPSRGGVRGGRDQFKWDDVKVDKHRENYLGHSIKAPVGRWQKGKDLHWYTRDKKSDGSQSEALKEEIRRIKEEEEQSMREALGLAPKRSKKSQGSRLDKHEYAELIKRGSTAEDLGAGHAEAAHVEGLGFSGSTRYSAELNLPPSPKAEMIDKGNITTTMANTKNDKREPEIESDKKKRRREERRHEKDSRREKRHSGEADEKRKHKRHKEKRRHDSD